MEINKIINVLTNLEKESKLLLDTAKLGSSKYWEDFNKIKSKVKMMVRRIYPNYQEVLKELFPKHLRVYSESFQYSYYIEDIEELIRAIKMIYEEMEIFGFEDFKPVREKIETEAGLRAGIFKLGIKKTKEK